MRRVYPPWVLLFLTCVAALVTRTSGDLDAASGASPLLVSLLDGTVQAVDRETGASLWSFSSGGPLVRAHTAAPVHGEVDARRDDSASVALRPSRGGPAVVFPGVDGSLYTLSSESSAGAGDGDHELPGTKAVVTRLPVTVRQLVEASPSMTRDGGLVLGTRTSVVFALDSSDGTLLRTFTAESVVMHSRSWLEGERDDDDDISTFALDALDAADASAQTPFLDAVFVGRTEYKVRSVDSRTGLERWNVTYGEVTPLTKTGGLFSAHARPSFDPTDLSQNDPTNDFDVELITDRSRGTSVRSLDGKWQKQFASVPIRAFDRKGKPKRKAVLGKRRDKHGAEDTIFVGAHAGGLYALPGRDDGGGSHGSGNTPDGNTTNTGTNINDGLVSFLKGGAADTAGTLVVVSRSVTEHDWACVPEHLAASALATKGRAYLDGRRDSLDGSADRPGRTDGTLWPSGARPDFDKAQAEKIKGTAMLTLIFGLGVGAAIVVATRAFSDPVFAETVGAPNKLASETQTKLADETPSSKLESPNGEANDPSRLDAGKKKRGARGKKRGGGGATAGDANENEPVTLSVDQPGIDTIETIETIETIAEAAVVKQNAPVSNEKDKPEPKTETHLRGEIKVGRLRVGPGVLGYGSCGTVVFEGVLDGRPVAVKRLLAHFHELALVELKTLIESDEHQNILRCFAMEEDDDFVYVALERCVCTLASLVVSVPTGGSVGVDVTGSNPSVGGSSNTAGGNTGTTTGNPQPFVWLHPTTKRPTREGLRLIRDAFLGVNALHASGIVHRDLKPQNVLVTQRFRGKLADMGLAKKLSLADGTSFETRPGFGGYDGVNGGTAGTGGNTNTPSGSNTYANAAPTGGTAGWLAPERLLGGRQTRSVDLFGLGCLLHYCLTGGEHPFGGRYERDQNVLSGGTPGLEKLNAVSREAADLVKSLVDTNPSHRPTAPQALLHPVWWSDATKLSFLCDVSDRVEMEDREVGGSLLLNDLERGALERKDGGLGETENGIGGKHKKWSDALPPALTENMGKYRSYNGREVRDLLRVIRNKSNHFRELPRNVRETVGDPPDAFYRYFETRFPKLALHAFEFVKKNVAHEPQFAKYFFGSAGEGEEGGGEGVTRRGSGGGGDAETTGASAALAKAARQIANGSARRASARASLVASSPAVEYPERPGAPECGFYVKTGRCKFGGRCHFHHPKGVHQ